MFHSENALWALSCSLIYHMGLEILVHETNLDPKDRFVIRSLHSLISDTLTLSKITEMKIGSHMKIWKTYPASWWFMFFTQFRNLESYSVFVKYHKNDRKRNDKMQKKQQKTWQFSLYLLHLETMNMVTGWLIRHFVLHLDQSAIAVHVARVSWSFFSYQDLNKDVSLREL